MAAEVRGAGYDSPSLSDVSCPDPDACVIARCNVVLKMDVSTVIKTIRGSTQPFGRCCLDGMLFAGAAGGLDGE